MLNRGAVFAVAVAKERTAFAKEVGVFNDYDDNKMLCRLGDDSELLEAAYRWARAAVLAGVAANDGIDVSVIAAAIDEARKALRETARIEGKAKAIAHGADEIRSLVTFQVRRMKTALDDAAAGLAASEETRVAS